MRRPSLSAASRVCAKPRATRRRYSPSGTEPPSSAGASVTGTRSDAHEVHPPMASHLSAEPDVPLPFPSPALESPQPTPAWRKAPGTASSPSCRSPEKSRRGHAPPPDRKKQAGRHRCRKSTAPLRDSAPVPPRPAAPLRRLSSPHPSRGAPAPASDARSGERQERGLSTGPARFARGGELHVGDR